MNRVYSLMAVLPIVLFAGTSFGLACNAEAQDAISMAITSPKDNATVETDDPLELRGELGLPKSLGRNDVVLRVRLYFPKAGGFIIAQEAAASIDETNSKLFSASLKGESKLHPGTYLLRVDCLNKTKRSWPVAATTASFIKVKPAHNTIQITTPDQATPPYSPTSNIYVAGESTEEEVVKVRIRFWETTSYSKSSSSTCQAGRGAGH